MKHNNGYKFKFSDRSKKHQLGLDFSKLVIVSKDDYIGESSTIDIDEYKEFEKQENHIHKNLENIYMIMLNMLMVMYHYILNNLKENISILLLNIFIKNLGL